MASLVQMCDFLKYCSIEFVQEPPDRLKCVICKKVLRNAMQTSCGCKVCEKCINDYLENGEKSCPSKQPDCSDTILMLTRDIYQNNAINMKITKIKLKDHLEDGCVAHNNTLVATLVRLQDENKYLTEELEQLKKKFVEQMNNTTKLTESRIKSNVTIEELKKMLVEQMSVTGKLTESRIKSERAIEELKKKGSCCASVEMKIVFRNGNYIWKISDLEGLKADAESGGKASVTSDPFYTSEFGYKMCLRIYPAGKGVGRGTHLSVFFAIMRGDYDDLLSWPFKQKVTLSLLDQENCGTENYSDTFKPDARSACYQKPIYDCNLTSGSPQFIALASLIPSSIYCRGDTIFLKISVDTIGISKP